jgi:hypothetical protein
MEVRRRLSQAEDGAARRRGQGEGGCEAAGSVMGGIGIATTALWRKADPRDPA